MVRCAITRLRILVGSTLVFKPKVKRRVLHHIPLPLPSPPFASLPLSSPLLPLSFPSPSPLRPVYCLCPDLRFYTIITSHHLTSPHITSHHDPRFSKTMKNLQDPPSSHVCGRPWAGLRITVGYSVVNPPLHTTLFWIRNTSSKTITILATKDSTQNHHKSRYDGLHPKLHKSRLGDIFRAGKFDRIREDTIAIMRRLVGNRCGATVFASWLFHFGPNGTVNGGFSRLRRSTFFSPHFPAYTSLVNKAICCAAQDTCQLYHLYVAFVYIINLCHKHMS